ncbi:MAG: LiaF domain-containing protein [Gemmatimonadota bacterium]
MDEYRHRSPNEHTPLAPRRSFTLVRDESVEPHRGALAVMGSIKRRGVWAMPRRFRVAAVMSEAKIDLREARIGAGESVVEVFALWASVEIIVPPGVHIEVQDHAIMGEVNWDTTDEREMDHDAPVIFVRGSVIMSSVEVKVRYLGETDKEAKKRLKARTSYGL